MNAAEVDKPQRKVNAQNQIWHFSEKGQTFIGFTESFLETVRECWHVTPSHRTQATENAPLMSIETDDCFFSIASPVSGAILRFDSMAMNFPDKLTDTTNIFIIGEKAVKPQGRAQRAEPVAVQREPVRFFFDELDVQHVASNVERVAVQRLQDFPFTGAPLRPIRPQPIQQDAEEAWPARVWAVGTTTEGDQPTLPPAPALERGSF